MASFCSTYLYYNQFTCENLVGSKTILKEKEKLAIKINLPLLFYILQILVSRLIL